MNVTVIGGGSWGSALARILGDNGHDVMIYDRTLEIVNEINTYHTNKSKYPCEIMLTDIKTDITKTSDDKYYIEIKSSDIEDGFQINRYYKVQIRFTAAGAASIDLTPPQAIDS